MGPDAVTDALVLADVDAPIAAVTPESPEASPGAAAQVKDRVLMVCYTPVPSEAQPGQPAVGPRAGVAIRTWAPNLQQSVASQGPASIVVVVPDEAKDQWERVSVQFPRGAYGLDPDGTAEQRLPIRGVPLLYVREAALGGMPPAGARIVASILPTASLIRR